MCNFLSFKEIRANYFPAFVYYFLKIMRGHSTQQGEQTSSITTARKLKYFSFHLRLITILHGYLPVHSE